MLAQTCGPCRATNYPALLRKALCEAGFGDVPVLTLSGGSLNNQPGFAISARLLHRLILGCLYGDMLQRVSLSTRAHERNAGDTDDRLAHWMNRVKFSAARGDSSLFKSHMRSIVRDFSAIRQAHAPLPRVGIVGEILLKYHPDANNQVIRHIMEEGGEPVLTDLMDFFLYCLLDPVYLWRHMGGKAFPAFSNWLLIKRIESLRDAMRRASPRQPQGQARKHHRWKWQQRRRSDEPGVSGNEGSIAEGGSFLQKGPPFHNAAPHAL